MKAIITDKTIHNGKNLSGGKELVSAYSIVGMIEGEMREIVVARCYMGRSRSASTVYASIWVNGIWVNGEGFSVSGSGRANGYGYHKESTAIGEAISSAGIELYDSTDKREPYKTRAYIDGVGERAIEMALEAIAIAAGAKGKILTIIHS